MMQLSFSLVDHDYNKFDRSTWLFLHLSHNCHLHCFALTRIMPLEVVMQNQLFDYYNILFTEFYSPRSKSSQGRIIRQKRRRHMIDLLFNLSLADLLVGVVTIPLDLLLESGFSMSQLACQSSLAIGNGKTRFKFI